MTMIKNEASNLLPKAFIFNAYNQQVRTVLIENQPYFVAKDVCDSLHLSDVSMSVSRLDDDEKLTQALFVSGQNREMWLVNESGLYNLIFRSNKPEARAFRKWVTNEVLPSIRKTGAYAVPTPQLVLQVPKVKYRYRTRIVPAAMNPQDRQDLEAVRRFRDEQGGNLCRVAQTMLDNHTAYMDLIGDGVDYQDLKRRFHHTHDLVKFLLELNEKA